MSSGSMTLGKALVLAIEALRARGTGHDERAAKVLEKKANRIQERHAQRTAKPADTRETPRRMDRGEILDDLASTVCRCENAKGARQSFCSPCFSALPGELRKALWDTAGYEWSYEAALDHLGIHPKPLDAAEGEAA